MNNEYTAEMAHAAAERGAAWLDKRCPDWVNEIDLRELDLSSPENCVLGQTAQCLVPELARTGFVNYCDVLTQFAPVAEAKWARRYGFECPLFEHPSPMACYEMLTIAWKELIRGRLEAKSA